MKFTFKNKIDGRTFEVVGDDEKNAGDVLSFLVDDIRQWELVKD